MDKHIERHYGNKDLARIYDVTTKLSGYEDYYCEVLRRTGIRARNVLDVGCGTGMFTRALEEIVDPEVLFGVDLSPPMLKVAAKNTRRASLFVGDAHDLNDAKPFIRAENYAVGAPAKRQFDLVTTAGMLEYLQDPKETFRRLVDRVVPGGHIIVTLIRNNIVGRVASKLYGFTIVSPQELFEGFDAKKILLEGYLNPYLRSLKASYIITRRGSAHHE